jgi:hypothetical protein
MIFQTSSSKPYALPQNIVKRWHDTPKTPCFRAFTTNRLECLRLAAEYCLPPPFIIPIPLNRRNICMQGDSYMVQCIIFPLTPVLTGRGTESKL